MSTAQRTAYGPFLRSQGLKKGHSRNEEATTSEGLVSEEVSTVNQPTEPEVDATTVLLHSQQQTLVSTMAEVIMHPFCGNPGDRADLWLSEYSDYCKCKGLTDERKQMSLRFFLKDHAKQWYLSLPATTTSNYDVLVAAFRERFNGSDGAISISSIKQRVGESCSSYFTRFLAATNQKNYPADLLVQFALEGLVDPIKHILMLQNLTDFDSVRLAALRAERTVSAQTAQVASLQSRTSDMDLLTSKLDMIATLLLDHRASSQVQAAHPVQQAQQYQRTNQPANPTRCCGKRCLDLSRCRARKHQCKLCLKIGHFEQFCSMIAEAREFHEYREQKKSA